MRKLHGNFPLKRGVHLKNTLARRPCCLCQWHDFEGFEKVSFILAAPLRILACSLNWPSCIRKANKFGKIDSKVRRKRKEDKKSWLRISRWAIQRQKRIRAYRSVFIVKFYKKYISKIFRRKNSLGLCLRRRKKLFKKLFLERARNRMAWSSELQVPNIGTSESEGVAWNEMTLLEGQLILQNFG